MESLRSKRKRSVDDNGNSHGGDSKKNKVGLLPTPEQLRQIWCYDNECGSLYMRGCPMRTCSIQEIPKPDNGTDEDGLTPEQMVLIKDTIKDMWVKAATVFEVFYDKDEEEKGYRLRVRKDLAMKLTISKQDAVPMGWIAEIPESLSGLHVYSRSPVAPNGYLGGPISYINWCPSNQQNVRFLKCTSKSHIFNMCTKGSLQAGFELLWDYGSNLHMPESGDWFKNECCQVVNASAASCRRYSAHQRLRSFVFKEQCVLCGHTYSMENKDNKINRKQHLAGKHADFLGSDWDGTDIYRQQVVDVNILLQRTDELNEVLATLSKLRWNILPACKVFSQSEVDAIGGDPEALMDEFERRRELLKKGGTLVLRGLEFPSLPVHFKPIHPSQWKILNWKGDVTPVNGRYAVPLHLKEAHEVAVSKLVSDFCEKYVNM